MNWKVNILAIATCLATLTGCGGSDSSDGGDLTEPVWVAGQYLSADLFANKCEAPRIGTQFPDVQGTAMHEKMWLRSWSDDTYLWYNELPDLDPQPFSVSEYFNLLKTTDTTASGNPKDRFHFSVPTSEWDQLINAGINVGYGMKFQVLSSTPPRKAVILLTEPNTPAENANISRGSEIIEIDDIDFINNNTSAGVAILNAGLFPQTNGETHKFTLRDTHTGETRTITLTSGEITTQPVRITKTLDIGGEKVGYMLFNSFIGIAEQQLISAFEQFQADNVSDLVIDLRYNGGGLLALASQLSYMIAGSSATTGKTFEKMTFNDKHPTFDPVTGQRIEPMPFFTQTLGFSTSQGKDLPKLALNRVFILTTSGTCSASEAVINGLRGIDVDVVQIGATTCGKPYGFYGAPNCGTSYFTIQFKGVNDKDFGDYADGFSPANIASQSGELIEGCFVNDDFSHDLGDENEAMLAAALEYRQNPSCPPLAPAPVMYSNVQRSLSALYVNSIGIEASKVEDKRTQSLFTQNRILLPSNR